jgi:hypothetical protein
MEYHGVRDVLRKGIGKRVERDGDQRRDGRFLVEYVPIEQQHHDTCKWYNRCRAYKLRRSNAMPNVQHQEDIHQDYNAIANHKCQVAVGLVILKNHHHNNNNSNTKAKVQYRYTITRYTSVHQAEHTGSFGKAAIK